MEGLLEKIQIFTADGSPNVSELIELQEIARKIKVSRTDLEKMIKKSLVAVQKASESSNTDNLTAKKEDPYKRLDYEVTRNSFEVEMEQRRASESIPESQEITFNRPEIVFPERKDPFAIKENSIAAENVVVPKERSENTRTYDVESLEKEEKENYNRTSKQAMQEQHAVETENQRKQEEQLRKYELEVEKYKQNGSIKEAEPEVIPEKPPVSIDAVLGEISGSENETKEAIDNASKTTSFEVAFEKLDQKDNLGDWVKNSNQEALAKVKALMEKQNQLKQRKREAEFKGKQQEEKYKPKKSTEEWLKTPSKGQKSKKKVKTKKKRSFARDNVSQLDDEAVKLTKSAFTLGVVALVLSILFGGFGSIVGVFALKSASKGIKKYKINARSFEKGAYSKLKNGRTMAIIGIVIGVFKFARVFYWKCFLF